MSDISRIYNIKTKECMIVIKDSSCVAYSSNSNILASVVKFNDNNCNKSCFNLYDSKNIVKGPFKTFFLVSNYQVMNMKFSKGDIYLIIHCLDNLLIIVDHFTGDIVMKLSRCLNVIYIFYILVRFNWL